MTGPRRSARRVCARHIGRGFAALSGAALLVLGAGAPVRAGAAPARSGADTGSRAAAAPSTKTAPTLASGPVDVQLTMAGAGAQRTIRTTFTLRDGSPIRVDHADVSALTANPDVRVATVPLREDPARPLTYIAVLTFPEDGAWVLTVRYTAREVAGPEAVASGTAEPMTAVELFSERIEGAGPSADPHDLAANPGRRAVLRQNPNFYEQYTPGGYVASSGSGAIDGRSSAGGHVLGVDETTGEELREPLDVEGVAIAVGHAIGALAWAGGTVVLAAVVWLRGARPSTGLDHEDWAVRGLRRWYGRTAGIGLLVVVLSGPLMAQQNSAGLDDPAALLRTGVGTAYLVTFAVKMTLVLLSLLSAVVIDRRAKVVHVEQLALAGGGTIDVELPVDTEALIASIRVPATVAVIASGGILVCVTVLSQLHLLLH